MIRWRLWLVPAVLVAVVAVIVVVAPAEKTLGQGIKSIYVHVALTWTGMMGLLAAGVLGLGVVVTARPRWQHWSHILGWVAIAAFVGGLLMSMVAAQINWGGIFWAEPRAQMALRIVAMALIAQILATWVPNLRLRGVLHLLAAVYMLFTVWTTELVLHPQSPILTSDSRAIQLTFAVLFGLTALVALWAAWQFGRRRSRSTT
jgi:hypothetical protein